MDAPSRSPSRASPKETKAADVLFDVVAQTRLEPEPYEQAAARGEEGYYRGKVS